MITLLQRPYGYIYFLSSFLVSVITVKITNPGFTILINSLLNHFKLIIYPEIRKLLGRFSR